MCGHQPVWPVGVGYDLRGLLPVWPEGVRVSQGGSPMVAYWRAMPPPWSCPGDLIFCRIWLVELIISCKVR